MRNTDGLASFQPDYNLCEYSLVICPQEAIQQKLASEKAFFCEAYQQSGSYTNTALHIVLAHFLAKQVMEETLIRWIQNICNLQTSFTVTLNNFSGLPPHTIYVRVQDAKPFAQVASQLKIIDGFIQAGNCPPLHTIARPYLPLAQGLPELVYEKAIKDYAQRSFCESFKVEKLILLKREDAYSNHEIVNTFRLAPENSFFE